MDQQGPAITPTKGAHPALMTNRDRVAVLERMVTSQVTPVIDGTQYSISREGEDYCLTIEGIGRAKSVRDDVIVGGDGQYKSAKETVETDGNSTPTLITFVSQGLSIRFLPRHILSTCHDNQSSLALNGARVLGNGSILAAR